MSALYEVGETMSSPKVPLPLDPVPQTLHELIQQKERWSPTPKSYFDAGYESHASRSLSPSPAKRRRVGRNAEERDQKSAVRQIVRAVSRAGGLKEWGLDEEVASESTIPAERPSNAQAATGTTQNGTTSYEADNDSTKTDTEREKRWDEASDMLVDVGEIEISGLYTETGELIVEDSATTSKAIPEHGSQDPTTCIKLATKASSIPAHIETRRAAIPLSPKQVNMLDQRTNRSFLRDEIKVKTLTNGEEENNGAMKDATQVECKTSVSKPKAAATPDVFGGVADEGIDQKPVTSTTKPLGKSVPTNSVRATFVKPALPTHQGLRGPVDPSETLRNSTTKKVTNPLNAKPSVFYDAPTGTSKSAKRTASMSLMDSTLSASANRDSSIIALRKKRRVEEPANVPSHTTAETGTGRSKEKPKAEPCIIRSASQKTADRHQLEDYKKSYTKAFPSFIFLFEIDLDKTQVRELKSQIRRLGGVSADRAIGANLLTRLP